MEKPPPFQGQAMQKTRLQMWLIRLFLVILIWTCLAQLLAVGKVWHPRLLSGFRSFPDSHRYLAEPPIIHSMNGGSFHFSGNYTSNGFLRVSCNGGLNQMRS
ncbi:hypothetical protein M569_03978, partial [Genlisea aurea]